MLSLIPKYLKEPTHCINAATTKFNAERLPGMDGARPGEVIAFENCVHVTRVPSPILHMQEGVVQFEQWRLFLEKMQSMVTTARHLWNQDMPSRQPPHVAMQPELCQARTSTAARTRTLFSWPTVSLCHCTQERSMPSDDPSKLTIKTVRWHGRNCLEELLRLPGS